MKKFFSWMFTSPAAITAFSVTYIVVSVLDILIAISAYIGDAYGFALLHFCAGAFMFHLAVDMSKHARFNRLTNKIFARADELRADWQACDTGFDDQRAAFLVYQAHVRAHVMKIPTFKQWKKNELMITF